MIRVLVKILNWKNPGTDNVQDFYLKNLTPLNVKLVVYLRDCLGSGVVHDWLTKVQTVLIQKKMRPRGILQAIIDLLHANT